MTTSGKLRSLRGGSEITVFNRLVYSLFSILSDNSITAGSVTLSCLGPATLEFPYNITRRFGVSLLLLPFIVLSRIGWTKILWRRHGTDLAYFGFFLLYLIWQVKTKMEDRFHSCAQESLRSRNTLHFGVHSASLVQHPACLPIY